MTDQDTAPTTLADLVADAIATSTASLVTAIEHRRLDQAMTASDHLAHLERLRDRLTRMETSP